MAEVGFGQPDGEGEEEDEVRFTLVRFPNPLQRSPRLSSWLGDLTG